MMILDQIQIKNRNHYNDMVQRGFNPLIDWQFFTMPIDLRIEIQHDLFLQGSLNRTNIEAANNRFYHWVWNNKYHICEETNEPLKQYSSVYISHILTRQAFPEISLDPRNTNILNFRSHNAWEFGTLKAKKKMRIYPINEIIMELLKHEYGRT